MTKATSVLSLRLGGAVLASAAFGLIAVAILPNGSLLAAIGLGFLFGTSFIGGTGYRIVLASLSGERQAAPASWSGATTGAAVFALVLWGIALLLGRDGLPVLMGFGIGINIAYLLAKAACVSADCCHAAPEHRLPVDLRTIEIAGTIVTLAAAVVVAMISLRLGAIIGIGGHLAIRLLSRRTRNRWSWGWPPLRQPGAELAPLVAVLVAAMLPV